MEEHTLTRSPEDRRLYILGTVGSLRFEGLFSRAAVAEAGARSWRFARRGMFSARADASDAAGTLVGEFEPRALRRGGAVRWSRRSYDLRPASAWRERYALAEGDRELALIEGKGWGRRPVHVGIEDASISPALLLFAAFLVRGLAEDAGSAAAAASSTAATG